MSTKFFNNTSNNTLFEKLANLSAAMGQNFHEFLAVTGFFRSSGYFKLRAELENIQKIRILVGINMDDIFRCRNKATLWFGDAEKAKQFYTNDFIDDIKAAGYADAIEAGILQFVEDLKMGRLELRIHPSKTLHAKFYLCLPEKHSPHSDGWVIMGSSNLSDAGLGTTRAPHYELNVAMKDYDDVAYCKTEFERLWSEGQALTGADIAPSMALTHLGSQPTPFEIYMKVLIDTFGEQVEDHFSLELPDGFRDLAYQRDAVIQGYQMLCRHNGFFLADVVGLGKTVVAAMIARRFLEANGKTTKILVVYPPVVAANWKETFQRFNLKRYTQFVSNGSLTKVLQEKDNYLPKEYFDLVIVDESHNFRHTHIARFDDLQKICKAPRINPGNLGETHGSRKKVMLLSATAVNNEPDDLRSQILLFQDAARSTIENVPNIAAFFAPLSAEYKETMRKRDDPTKFAPTKIDAIYEKIRCAVLEPITVRRTRQNILNDENYAADLVAQGVAFPKVTAPEILKYELDPPTEELLLRTLWFLTAEEVYRKGGNVSENAVPVDYARYRAIEFLKPKQKKRYEKADQVATALKSLYRVLMVKRLESSFYAFRRSLENAIKGIEQMLAMFAQDQVLIVPEVDIRSWLDQGKELDDIITKLVDEHGYCAEDFVYRATDFHPEFIEMLRSDKMIFEGLLVQWQKITSDPKFNLFLDTLQSRLTAKPDNPTGKVVVFSESLDTIKYLEKELAAHLKRKDILAVSSGNREQQKKAILRSFDANYCTAEQENCYNILLSTDVLSEGINLHRSNTVVHYDTPWNVARLMQRIGRVNRIGSTAAAIRNFTFYPSDQGNREIRLYENALIKMQGFQSALGEDVQIFSHHEIVKQFELFDSGVKDDVDETLALLREIRRFYNQDPTAYKRIKALPLKSRCMRTGKQTHTVAFIKAAGRIQFYDVTTTVPTPITLLEAVKHLRATPDEKPLPFASPASIGHYADVTAALSAFEQPPQTNFTISRLTAPAGKDRNSRLAESTLRACLRWAKQGSLPTELVPSIEALQNDLAVGIHTMLPHNLAAAVKPFGVVADQPTPDQIDKLPGIIATLSDKYVPTLREKHGSYDDEGADSIIVISETFIKAQSNE